MKFSIITNCTNRKRSSSIPIESGFLHDNRISDVKALAECWTNHVSIFPTSHSAIETYSGRSVREVEKTARLIDGEIFFISAGLGLVSARKTIPNYDLTVSDGYSSIIEILKDLNASTADWWNCLSSITQNNTVNSVKDLIATPEQTVLLIALPSNYIKMIKDDLGKISHENAYNIRIFSSSTAKSSIPEHLQKCLMPYDDRLESSNIPGTKTDFSQRALYHFVSELKGHQTCLDNGHSAVIKALESLHAPIIPTRIRLADDEIIKLLRQNWHSYNGQSSKLLRFLRDEALVACEQSRFRQLWLQVQQTLL